MRKNYIASIAAAALIVMLGLTGCKDTTQVSRLTNGGTLCIKVNPEIAVTYDAEGLVTELTARNADAQEIIASVTGYEGKQCREVVGELVTAIGEAGYFVEEIEGERRQIVIEIEDGSDLPNKDFLDNVVDEVYTSIKENNWNSPINVDGKNYYNMTDYDATDYGTTDYHKPTQTPVSAPIPTQAPTAAPTPDTDYDMTDYLDTDYGTNNDGTTDYLDTDYGTNNDGVTDYDVTDYGTTDYHKPTQTPVSAPIPTQAPTAAPTPDTDYDVTDYGTTDYHKPTQAPVSAPIPTQAPTAAPTPDTDYDMTDYNATDYAVSSYDTTDYGISSYDASDYHN